jgi:hypothetical protein
MIRRSSSESSRLTSLGSAGSSRRIATRVSGGVSRANARRLVGHLVQNAAERKDVAARVCMIAANLLGNM